MQNILKPLVLEENHIPRSYKTRRGNTSVNDRVQKNWTKKYFSHLHTLFLGLIGYTAVCAIFLFVEPAQIQHTFLTNSFLPLLITFTLANFFLFSFVWLNSRRGFFTSVFLTLLLFLKLQGVFSFFLLFSFLIFFLLLELLLTIAAKK